MTASTLLLHGFTGSSASWGVARDHLRAAGHDPVVLDLPGHGVRADAPAAYSLGSTLAWIDAAYPEGEGTRALIGYSMGGRIALHYAVEAARSHPGRLGGLVLESASPGIQDDDERAERRAADEELARVIERDGIQAFVDRWEELPLFATQRTLPTAIRDGVREARLRNRPAGLATALRILGTGSLPSLWDELSALSVPTLVLVGGLDRKFVEIGERMVERLPGSSLHVVPDAGHAVHLERPAAWARAVSDFLGGRC